ncbi:helix-turn-helix transcriptional regulator [Brevibacillus reuszeri]|uniref:helix-turn-helix transcriptional regulator n=1 Tax=Brevibacillus reuszeri TaxID=54915 RepID=UPI002896D312|nr:AraC family transcriptional regulator [Brevibacillus reuszeri]
MQIQNEFVHFSDYNAMITKKMKFSPLSVEMGEDKVYHLPTEWGTGYYRHTKVREGLMLDYSDMVFQEGVSLISVMKYPHLELALNIENGANWSIPYEQEEYLSQSGTAQLIYMNDVTCYAEMPKNKRVIHLELCFDYLQWKSLLQEMNARPEQSFAALEITITPSMLHIAQQLMDNPYRGTIRTLFQEGKTMELMALFLQEVQIGKRQGSSLKADDIKSIHEAKNILLQTLECPPSLIHLARKVGINDHKLKIGFKEVFGTTVFGYVRQQRLEKAKRLLEMEKISVSEASSLVGYSNFSHFASLFRKTYGMNPGLYTKKQ